MRDEMLPSRLELLRGDKLRIRTRCVVNARGGRDIALVECPRQRACAAVDECLGCQAYQGLSFERDRGRSFVICRAPGTPPPASSLALAKVADWMSPKVVCVRADLPAVRVGDLFLAQSLRSAPVVDEEGRPIGVISQHDLLGHERTPATAGDLMTPVPFFVRSDAPIGVAAALMAYEGVDQVPVVADDGRVIGIFTALDVTRWVAECEGHHRSES